MSRRPEDGAPAAGPGRGEPQPGTEVLRVVQWVRLRWWNACAWYAVSLAEALARRGHVSYLAAPAGTPAALEAARRGLAVPDLGDLGGVAPGEWLRSGHKWSRFLLEARIDLVNAHSGPGHARLARRCLSLGLPLVRTRGDIRPPRATPLQGLLYRQGTTHHLAVAEFIRSGYYERLGVPPERITTLRGGVDTEALARISTREAGAEARRRLGLGPDALLLGMIARLSPVKGHSHFLRAFSRVLPRIPQAHAVLVGPDAQLTRADLEQEARELGIGRRVHLLGRVEDPLFWAAALDVAVIASLDSEAICRSALEYMGLARPLVATNVHAIPEIVVEGTGLVVAPADSEALASALLRLCGSPEWAAALGRAGREHVGEHYSLSAFGASAERLFAGLAREADTRRAELALGGSGS